MAREDKNAVIHLFRDKLTSSFWGGTGLDQHRGAHCRYQRLEGRQQLRGAASVWYREVLSWDAGIVGTDTPVRCP